MSRINRVWVTKSYFDPNSIDMAQSRLSRIWHLCRFCRNFDNLEFEADKSQIFSTFLRVDCARKKICSVVYFLRFLRHNLSAARNFNCSMYALCSVQCRAGNCIDRCTLYTVVHCTLYTCQCNFLPYIGFVLPIVLFSGQFVFDSE